MFDNMEEEKTKIFPSLERLPFFKIFCFQQPHGSVKTAPVISKVIVEKFVDPSTLFLDVCDTRWYEEQWGKNICPRENS